MTAAVLICIAIILTWLGAYTVLTRRPDGKHARPHLAKHELDPLCPACRKYICMCGESPLRGTGRLPYITEDGAKIAATSQLVTTVLARVQDTMPVTANTGDMPALLADGTMTPAQVTGHLAGKYLTAPAVTR